MKISQHSVQEIIKNLQNQLEDQTRNHMEKRSQLVDLYEDSLSLLDEHQKRERNALTDKLFRYELLLNDKQESTTFHKCSECKTKKANRNARHEEAPKRVMPFRKARNNNAILSSINKQSRTASKKSLAKCLKETIAQCSHRTAHSQENEHGENNLFLNKTSTRSNSLVLSRSSKLNSPYVSPIISPTISPFNTQQACPSSYSKASSSSSSLPSLKFDIVDAFVERNKFNDECKNLDLDTSSWSPYTNISRSPNVSSADISDLSDDFELNNSDDIKKEADFQNKIDTIKSEVTANQEVAKTNKPSDERQ